MHLLALPWIIYAIVSQPPGNALYINDAPNVVTRYQLAQGYGLLAHSRPEWQELEAGQLVYADGHAFRVAETHLLTVDSFSRFRDEKGEVLSAEDVLNRYFGDPNGLTLMTCLGSDERLFILAKSVNLP